MIHLHGPDGAVDPARLDEGARMPDHAVWIDLDDPSEDEARLVQATTGLRVPSREALREVESSSRLRRNRDGVLLSTPMITFDRSDFSLKPLGFVLTPDRLLTVRFHEMRAFATVKTHLSQGVRHGSTDVFLLLVEEIVDSLADTLEEMSGDLDALSTRIFDFDVGARPGARKGDTTAPKRRDLALRRLLRSIGRQGKSLAKVRASLLGLGRLLPFVKGECEDHGTLRVEDPGRFDTIGRDIASLDEFETRLSETLQFLLDAALGLINIEQNNAFRILTVVSVVGIPPTLIASLYGMNFKHMPELDWAYGYPYGLALIAISALLPVLIFRIKGWV